MVESEGGYDLQLKYDVIPEEMPAIIIPANQVLRTSNSTKPLIFYDLVRIPDSHWRWPFHVNVFRVYPQSLDVNDAVNRLKNGKSLPVVSESASV